MARSDTKSSQQRKELHRSTHAWQAQAEHDTRVYNAGRKAGWHAAANKRSSKKSSSTRSAQAAGHGAPQLAASVSPLVALAATAQQTLLTAQSAAAAGAAQDAVQTAALNLLGDTRTAIQAEVARVQAALKAPAPTASGASTQLSLPPSSLTFDFGYAADADDTLSSSSAYPGPAAESPAPPRRHRAPPELQPNPPQQQQHVQQLQPGAVLDDAEEDADMRDAEREQAFEARVAHKLKEQERELAAQHAREEQERTAQHARKEQERLAAAQERAARDRDTAVAEAQRELASKRAREEQVRLRAAQEQAAREKEEAVALAQRQWDWERLAQEQKHREQEQEWRQREAAEKRRAAERAAHEKEAHMAAKRAEREKAAVLAQAQLKLEEERRQREAEEARRAAEHAALEKNARRAAEQAAQDQEAAVARARCEWEQQRREEEAAEARRAAQQAEQKAREQHELNTRRAEQEAQKAAFIKASSRAPQGQELLEISMRLHACTFGPNILEEARKKPLPASTLPPPNGLTTVAPLDTNVITPDPKSVRRVSKPRHRTLLAVDGNDGPEYFVKTVLGAFTSRGKETVKVRWGDQSVTDEPLSDSIKSTLAYKTYVREVAVAREIAARARAQSVAHAQKCVALVNRERAESKAQEVAARLAARDTAALNKKAGLAVFTTATSSPAPSSPRAPQPKPLQTRPHAQPRAAEQQPQRPRLPAPPPLKAPPARKLASDARHASLAPTVAPPVSPRAPAKIPAKLAAQAKRPPALPPSPPRIRPDASTSTAATASDKRRKDRSSTKDPLAPASQQRSKGERGKSKRDGRADSSSRRKPFTSAQRRQEEPRWASEEEREREDERLRSQIRREDEQYERNKQEIMQFTEMARRATEYSDVDEYMEAEMIAREEREEQEAFEAAERSMQVFGGSD